MVSCESRVARKWREKTTRNSNKETRESFGIISVHFIPSPWNTNKSYPNQIRGKTRASRQSRLLPRYRFAVHKVRLLLLAYFRVLLILRKFMRSFEDNSALYCTPFANSAQTITTDFEICMPLPNRQPFSYCSTISCVSFSWDNLRKFSILPRIEQSTVSLRIIELHTR